MSTLSRLATRTIALSILAGCSSQAKPAETSASDNLGDGGGSSTASNSSIASGSTSTGGSTSMGGGAEPTDASTQAEAAPIVRPADPCIAAGNCAPGTWVDVTPTTVDLVDGDCSNYGTKAAQVDPQRPQDIYTQFNCQGIWKSTDYGATWTGPINTGANGSMIGDCAAAISIARDSPDTGPTLYQSCIRGTGIGFWKSTNGGVDWTNYNVLPDGGQPTAVNQQFYAPAVDPYDSTHLLMSGHETDVLVQSSDGGQTWTNVTLDPGMISGNGGTAGINFVNTGVASTTSNTWLWTAANIGVDANGVGTIGTWRTADGGSTWKQVDENEHVNGSMHSEVFQPSPYTGLIYMAGSYSALGSGVLMSTDFGQTWTHVGINTDEAVVVGTPANIYAMYGWAAGAGETVDPALEVGAAPGSGTWTSPGTPAAMTQGAGQAAVTNDGTYNIVIMANYNAGLWRYIEPTN